jgi:DNA polymerase-3 subunit delta'
MRGNHADVVLVEAEGATSIGVDQVRSIVSRASLTPVEGSFTVFVIPEAGLMTEQAANVILKTLEEPSSTVFILVAESEEDFPATVPSRCRTIQLGRVPEPELTAALMKRGADESAASAAAMVAGGRPGLALSLMTEPDVAVFRSFWLSVPQRLTPHPGDAARIAAELVARVAPLAERAVPDAGTAEEKTRARRRAEQALLVGGLEILASWYADAASLGFGGPIRNRDLPLQPFTDVTPAHAVRAVDRVLDAVVDIRANLRRELVLAELLAGLGSEM